MILNHIVAISLLILTLILTTELFIKKDQELQNSVHAFEKNTKKLHDKNK